MNNCNIFLHFSDESPKMFHWGGKTSLYPTRHSIPNPKVTGVVYFDQLSGAARRNTQQTGLRFTNIKTIILSYQLKFCQWKYLLQRNLYLATMKIKKISHNHCKYGWFRPIHWIDGSIFFLKIKFKIKLILETKITNQKFWCKNCPKYCCSTNHSIFLGLLLLEQ